MSTIVENTPRAWSERALQAAPWDAALWSEGGQTQRFIAALKHLDLREGDSVLDFGCGSGRLCAFLPESVTYHAYDWAPGMLGRVQRDYERAVIHERLPDELFDHVVAIGPFNLNSDWSKDQTAQRISALWISHTRRTLVVSLYRGLDVHGLCYSPEWVAKLVRQLGCQRFSIDGTYLPQDLILEMCR